MRMRFIGLALMSCLLLTTFGCGPSTPVSTGTGTGTSTTTTPNLPDPTITADIQYGTSATLTLAFAVIKDQAAAQQIATLAKKEIDTTILPILNGDDNGLTAAIGDILALKAFDTPTLSKVKMILETALPLLLNHIDVSNKITGQVPPDVKAYLIAFFTGASNGCGNFTGVITAQKAKGVTLTVPELIKKLNE